MSNLWDKTLQNAKQNEGVSHKDEGQRRTFCEGSDFQAQPRFADTEGGLSSLQR